MSKKRMETSEKALKKENKLKKTKRKNLMVVSFCVLAVVVALAFVIHSVVRQSNVETYRDGGQMVQLHPDGNFAATLAHNVNKIGTYSKTVDGDRTIVTFNINGVEEVGWIENNVLRMPDEWDDGHNHGNLLPKR